jgi:hypothetical protein
MAEFKLSRIRFTWRGAWVTGTTYIKDDIVSYGGKSYVCLVGHSANTSLYTDLTSGNWTLWFDGYSYKGAWTLSTFYDLGSIVTYGSVVYVCSTQHTSAATTALGLEANQANWTSYAVTDNWLGVWANNTRYRVGDTVKYGGNIYRCNTAHTSVSTSTTLGITNITTTGTQVSYFFATQVAQPFFAGAPVTITGVNPGVYNGTFTVASASPSQVTITSTTQNAYVSGGSVTGIDALGLEYDQAKWDTVVLADKWLADWTVNTRYKISDVVRYGGIVYRCITGHISQATLASGLDADIAYWQVVISGVDFKPYWTANTRYKTNDIVKYGADLWICTSGHTSTTYVAPSSGNIVTTGFDPSKFSLYIPGVEYLNLWNATTVYGIGDIVQYGGYNYYNSLSNNLNNVPSLDSTDWTILTKNYRIKGDWSAITPYYVGDTVRRGGYLYTALLDNLNFDPNTNGTQWSLIIPGNKWQNVWTSGNSYVVGDVINYISSSYKCVLGHVASALNSPPVDVSNTYWVPFIQGAIGEVLEYVGDFATYNNSSTQRLGVGTVSNVLQVSTSATPGWDNFGAVVGGVYYVSTNGIDLPGYGQTLQDAWATIGYACSQIVGPATIFVKTGVYNEALPISIPAGVAVVGDELRSTTIQPAANGSVSTTATAITTASAITTGSTINGLVLTVGTVTSGTITAGMFITGANIATGTYIVSNLTGNGTSPGSTWTISISHTISIGQAINGATNLVTVSSTTNMSYSTASVTVGTIQNSIFTPTGTVTGTFTKGMQLSGTTIASGTTISSVNQFTATASISGGSLIVTAITSGIISIGQAISVPAGVTGLTLGTYITSFSTGTGGVGTYNLSNSISTPIASTTVSGIAYNTYVAGSLSSQNVSAGPVTGNASTAIQFISSNYAGLTQGQTYYIVGSTLTPTQFSVALTPNGQPITLSADASTCTVYGGYYISNMFYLRNSSGLRNMTLRGLLGGLTTANSYGTKRPTGGAYASLDPGMGTWDTSVQITTRSPYVQNVTTFGTGCIGNKIDGTLHAAGNRSIVANDFTQILSDGIGVWCTGTNALTEQVSTFSYYGYAGYLAENGGKIRATNGNSSYGTYGVVSEGYDPSETPLVAAVNNRTGQAIISAAFAGQANNKILKLEYANAGQGYSTASYTFSGAGIGASVVADEFRDNAVFEARVTGSTIAAGGSFYITAGNQAQGGNNTSITLASNDTNNSANYLGLRVVIVSGTGVGQYGYIQAYSAGTKVASIYTESTGVPGWDHAIAGTPIAPVLDSTSNYLIEPRVTFTGPGFTPTGVVTQSTAQWLGLVYGIGNSQGKFVSVSTTGASQYSSNGGTNWLAGSTLPNATWSALGYGNGKFVALSFLNVGGYFSGGNSISAVSTDGITWSLGGNTGLQVNFSDITYGNGVFVAVALGTTATAISSDGTTWTNGVLPSSQQWTGVVYGNVVQPSPLTGSGVWVAVSGGTTNSSVAAYSVNNGSTWTATTLPSSAKWIDVTYGNGRFVAIAAGGTASAYSFDGNIWYAGTLPSTQTWTGLSYGQGLFFAVATGTLVAATSQDGLNWTAQTMPSLALWADVAFGNPSVSSSVTPVWIAISGGTGTSNVAATVITGATTWGRAVVSSSKISQIKIWEPGSGYTAAPTITVTDPNIAINSGTAATFQIRTGLGVLGNPSFTNRGTGYQTTTTTITVSGNGNADVYQNNKYLIVSGLGASPSLGSALTVSGVVYTYKIVASTLVTAGVYQLQIAPSLDNSYAPVHGTAVNIRQKYSQIRLTGHDFLYIGTGNQPTTNYPNVSISSATSYTQILENNLGRVFQTSTDQDGNFKVGNLFSVQQATGIVTISADLFNLSGLTTLSLGGVSLGTNQVVITAFSTDSYFTANSDSIVPTQKAIKTYVSRNVSGGGSNASTGTANAGLISVGPFRIGNTVQGTIKMTNKVTFRGQGGPLGAQVPSGIDGQFLAMQFFAHGWKSEPGSVSTGLNTDAITNSQFNINGANRYNNIRGT